MRSHPVETAVSWLIAAMLVAGTVGAWVSYKRAQEVRRQAQSGPATNHSAWSAVKP